MNWIDKPSMTSVRDDGAKVGCFCVDGRSEWWGYPPSGCPTGPHETCEEAKRAVDAALPIPAIYACTISGPDTRNQHQRGLQAAAPGSEMA